MKIYIKLFSTAFIQVFMVSANVLFISRLNFTGMAICGFGISYVWTFNIKSIATGNHKTQLVYSVGAMMGGICGVLVANLFKK